MATMGSCSWRRTKKASYKPGVTHQIRCLAPLNCMLQLVECVGGGGEHQVPHSGHSRAVVNARDNTRELRGEGQTRDLHVAEAWGCTLDCCVCVCVLGVM